MSGKTVFISYSHDSPGHSQLILELAKALRDQGVNVEIDRYQVRPPMGWPHWCEEQLRPETSEFVIVICTQTYRQRVENKTAADEGRGVFWEGGIIYSYLYNEKANHRFIPVLLPGATEEDIPRPLRDHARYRLQTFDLSDPGYDGLYRELTHQPVVIKPELGKIVVRTANAANEVIVPAPLPARPVLTTFIPTDISRIIKYAPAELIGREDETALLNDAWAKAQSGEPKRPHVLTFVALGGEGKTSLVAKWAAELAHQDWPGCDAAFAWSFYSQGTREQVAASSDLFLKEALTFFGDDADKEFAASPAGAFEKGQRLARIVGQRRSLLILDGLEPLQYAPTSPTLGQLKDQGIAALLKGLATISRGLCIVTTRYSLPDLRAFWETTAPEEKLLRLSRGAGVFLLQSLGVKGSLLRNLPFHGEQVNEFEKLVEDVLGHALTLNLLGTYLRDAHAGDIRKRDLVKLEEADAEEQGGHAFRVMEAYEREFEREGDKGQRALAVIRLLGLFDRPITSDCLAALLQAPAIAGLTEPVIDLTEAQQNLVFKRLEDARLLSVNRDASGVLVSLDAHPLQREYFARQLRSHQPDAWRAANRRLYEHLCANTPDKPQPTLEDLQPLYQAMAHGCQGELHQTVYAQVYCKRILRQLDGTQAFYSTRKLGAMASDLSAIACFFTHTWRSIEVKLLREGDQAFLLNEAGYRLRSLGRLQESLKPMSTALQLAIAQGNWKLGANVASNICELKLSLGNVLDAIEMGSESMRLASRSDETDWESQIRSCTALAHAYHQANDKGMSRSLFTNSDEVEKRNLPHSAGLYTQRGFRLCELLLSDSEVAAWRRHLTGEEVWAIGNTANWDAQLGWVELRVTETRKYAQDNGWGLAIALSNLLSGRIALYRLLLGCDSDNASRLYRLSSKEAEFCRREIQASCEGLRIAGHIDHLSRGLLTHAWLRVLTGALTGPESAQADLEEAWEIAERGPMRLHMADIHLHRARLFFREAQYPWESPQADLAAAEKLINDCGYHRRDEELADAKAAILPR